MQHTTRGKASQGEDVAAAGRAVWKNAVRGSHEEERRGGGATEKRDRRASRDEETDCRAGLITIWSRWASFFFLIFTK
jgi:hypothetical protein